MTDSSGRVAVDSGRLAESSGATRQPTEDATGPAGHVDLGALVVHREPLDNAGPSPTVAARLARFGLPAILLAGLVALLVWSLRERIWPPRPVRVIPVLTSRAAPRRGGETLFQAAGWIEPRPTAVRVSALAGGVVKHLLVVEDQPLTKGEPIAELVDEDAKLICEKAEADLQLREAELREAQAGLAAARIRLEQPVHLEAALADAEAELAGVETQLAELPSDIRRAEARRDFAQANYRGKSAVDGAIAGRVIQEARGQFEETQAELDQLLERRPGLQRRQAALARRCEALRQQRQLRTDEQRAVREAEARTEAARARVRLAEVTRDEARLQLQRMRILAPLDGRVLHLVAQPGSRLQVGAGHASGHDAATVVTMYQPDHLQVRVDVRFEDLSRVRVGQPVRVSSPAVGEPLRGEVLLVGSEADIQKNTLEVKVAVDNPQARLKPEMLVDVAFLAPPQPAEDTPAAEAGERLRMFIPAGLAFLQEPTGSGSAGGFGGGNAFGNAGGRGELTGDGQANGQGETGRDPRHGSFVWVADQTRGVARKVPVELGSTASDGLIEVLAGIHPATRLIAGGHDQLRDGQAIRVVGEAEVSAQEIEGF